MTGLPITFQRSGFGVIYFAKTPFAPLRLMARMDTRDNLPVAARRKADAVRLPESVCRTICENLQRRSVRCYWQPV